MSSQRLVLAVHERDRLDLLVAGGEVPVPEERELFAERVGPVDDAVEPANLEQVDIRRGPRCLAQAVDRLGRFGGKLGRMEEPVDAGLGAGLEVAEQLRSGGAEAGATVQVRDLAQVPGIVGHRVVACPGGIDCSVRHCRSHVVPQLARTPHWPAVISRRASHSSFVIQVYQDRPARASRRV